MLQSNILRKFLVINQLAVWCQQFSDFAIHLAGVNQIITNKDVHFHDYRRAHHAAFFIDLSLVIYSSVKTSCTALRSLICCSTKTHWVLQYVQHSNSAVWFHWCWYCQAGWPPALRLFCPDLFSLWRLSSDDGGLLLLRLLSPKQSTSDWTTNSSISSVVLNTDDMPSPGVPVSLYRLFNINAIGCKLLPE